jgi:hypothetical protein
MAIRKVVSVFIFCFFVAVAAGSAAENQKEDAAIAATEKWVALVDEGKYAESWKAATEYFKNAVTQEQWEKAAQAVRLPLGKRLSRKVKSTGYETSLPGAPDGEYVVIQFETVFENKKAAIETVTTMLDRDGTWRVSGYFIQ